MPAGPERCGGSRNRSKRLLSTAGAAFYAAAGVKTWEWQPGITPRTHAIDAADNIDHLTRRALVRVEVGHVRGQDGLAADQRRRVPELFRDRSLDHITFSVREGHLHVTRFRREERCKSQSLLR